MCEEAVITSKLLDITKKLAESNVSFSISLNFTIKDKEFQFSASSSKKDQDQPVLQNKRKKSLSQRTRNLKRLLEYKEKKQKNLEITNSSESLKKSDDTNDVTVAHKDDLTTSTFKCDQWDFNTKKPAVG